MSGSDVVLAVIIVGGLITVALGLGFHHMEDEDCPRAVMGYNCKGDKCDHSPEELRRAKIAMKEPV